MKDSQDSYIVVAYTASPRKNRPFLAYPVGAYSTQDRARLAAVSEWERKNATVECVVYYSIFDSDLPADHTTAVLFDTEEILNRRASTPVTTDQLDWLKTIDLVSDE